MVHTPDTSTFVKGYKAFQRQEPREAMYRTASFLVDHFWNQPAKLADSLGVLLLTWNNAFYRYGPFKFERLEKCIETNLRIINKYRRSNINYYTTCDNKEIKRLFLSFLGALQRVDGAKSPVAVAKALHLLAPHYFPLWDEQIAKAYGYAYHSKPAEKYLNFLVDCKTLLETLKLTTSSERGDKTLLKLLDEYNYAKYTKGWI